MNSKIKRITVQTVSYEWSVVMTREAFILLVYMAVAASTLNTFMQTRSLREGWSWFRFSMMLDGTADRPYVYRQLVPLIANFSASLIPPDKKSEFEERHLDKYHLKELYFGKSNE